MDKVKLSTAQTLSLLTELEENSEYIELYNNDKLLLIEKLFKNREFMKKNKLVIHSPSTEVYIEQIPAISFNQSLNMIYIDSDSEISLSLCNSVPTTINSKLDTPQKKDTP